jgi:nitrilase
MSKTVLAAIQMASSPNVSANLIEAGRLVEKAASQGASLIVLPENFAIMGTSETDKLAVAEADGSGPIQDFLAQTAERLKVWLVGGTMPIRADNGKVRAAAWFITTKASGQDATTRFICSTSTCPAPTNSITSPRP